MNGILRRLRSLGRDESGQALVFIVLALITMFFFLATSVNLGKQAVDRLEIQNDADAAALTGATWLARGFNFLASVNTGIITASVVSKIAEAESKALYDCASGGGRGFCKSIVGAAKGADGGLAGEVGRLEAAKLGAKAQQKASLSAAGRLVAQWPNIVANEIQNVALENQVTDVAVYPNANFDERGATPYGAYDGGNDITMHVDIPGGFGPGFIEINGDYKDQQFIVAGVCKGIESAPLLGVTNNEGIPHFNAPVDSVQFAAAQARPISLSTPVPQSAGDTSPITEQDFVGRLVPFTGDSNSAGGTTTPKEILEDTILPRLSCMNWPVGDPAPAAAQRIIDNSVLDFASGNPDLPLH